MRNNVVACQARSRRSSTYRPFLEQLEARLLLAPLASAGPDQDVDRGGSVSLSGLGSTGEGTLTYTWKQISGPDVTSGTGSLVGAMPSFTAPTRVSTLVFDLFVADADGLSAADRVVVAALEDADNTLFVSPLGSNTNTGTRAAPLLTIQTAIARAALGGDDVYVSGGTYSESVSLATGVSLYGGFSGDSWLRNPTIHVTTIAGGPTAVLGTNAQNVVVDGLTIISADATTPGGSSIAIALSGASNVELSGNIIQARNGASGTDGAPGPPQSIPIAPAGNNGGAGSADGSTPGPGGAQTAGPEFGGKGGNGGPEGDNNGQPGSSGSGGAPGGSGGNGGDPGGDGGNGTAGANGTVGPGGSGGSNLGNVVGTQYAPANGANGGMGAYGKGGGGGGGGGGQGCTFCNDGTGNGGGSGGRGGQGGNGGTGGIGGGASIGVLVVNSTAISLHDNAISSANGGGGGRGGDGTAGQQGGAGGLGASIASGEVGEGGDGGKGGNGGVGGPGGGGGGGPSVGIYASATTTGSTANNSITTGTPGAGGTSSGSSNSDGDTGSVFLLFASVGSGFTIPPSNVMSLPASAVAENRPSGTLVGALNTSNSTAGAPFGYTLVAGIGDDDNLSFNISGNQLLTARPLDFETKSSYSVRIRSIDTGGKTVEKIFAISVTNVNDPPTCTIGPPQSTTDESGPQTVPGWVRNCLAEAPGNASQNLTVSLEVDKPELFISPPAIDGSGNLTYRPAPNVRGTATVTVTVKDDGGTAGGGADTSVSQLAFVVDKPHPWRNTVQPLDVTGDELEVAGDALEIINRINAFKAGLLPPRTTIEPPYFDVNGDNQVAPNDALDVINAINAGLAKMGLGSGEGEAALGSDPSLDELIALLAFDAETWGARGRRARL